MAAVAAAPKVKAPPVDPTTIFTLLEKLGEGYTSYSYDPYYHIIISINEYHSDKQQHQNIIQ
jgi:hypothetical protein